jgi:sugar (pentulose or hexulose) kinase
MQTGKPGNKVGRRDFLRALGAGAGAAAAVSGTVVDRAAAAGTTKDEKRKSRYQPNSPDIQAYYRVNRYPSK